MNNKPQSQDEPKTAFIPEIEVPGEVREDVLKNVTDPIDQILELFKRFMPENIAIDDRKQLAMYTAYHKIKALSPLPSSMPTEVHKEELKSEDLFKMAEKSFSKLPIGVQTFTKLSSFIQGYCASYVENVVNTPVSSAPPISQEDEK